MSLARVGDSWPSCGRPRGHWWQEFRTARRGRRGAAPPPCPPRRRTGVRRPSRSDAQDVLLLATDGVADPWRDGPTTVAPVLAAALAQPPAPLELAHLANFSRQGCHDDRTMLVVWRRGDAALIPR